MRLPNWSALLVIDVQRGFDDPKWGFRNNLGAEANVGRLISAWRAAGMPVIHVRHQSLSSTGSFRPGERGHLAMPEAQESAGEPIYLKTAHSAFIGTTLEADLRKADIGTVVIVGLTTNHCVATTARMASDLGFATYVVSDATAAFEGEAIDGSFRSANQIHLGALSDLNGEFAAIVETGQLLAGIRREQASMTATAAAHRCTG